MKGTQLGNLVKEVKTLLEPFGESAQLSGLNFTMHKSQRALMTTLAKSFIISLSIICVLALAWFRSPRYFFAFLAVNIAPLGPTVLCMWMFGLSLNIATIMTFSVSLGLVVDGSFHLAHALTNGHSPEKTLYETRLPVAMSGILLALSFSLFAPQGFLPVKEFGLCLCIGLFFGAVFDLLILPALLGQHKLSAR